MLLLADGPDRLSGLAARWSPAPASALEADDRALWRVLGNADRLWLAEAEGPGPAGFWSRVLVVAEARASQFDALREALAAGLSPRGPLACLALSGHGFHGQRGRPWQAAPGNLHLCAALPSPGLAAREAGALPMLPAVALVDAVRAMTGAALRPGIRWVNDVLLDGSKVGGVLTASQTQGDAVTAVVVGIGLNVAIAPSVPPTPFVPSVGSLALAGSPLTWQDAWPAVLDALGRRLVETARHGPASLLQAYRDASLVVGREVCVFEDAEPPAEGSGGPPRLLRRGLVRAIRDDLSLLLEGQDEPVTRGRLAFAEHCGHSGA
jgi:BirA family biotin operon repressor/biotin-[acetyl-CoA-carboxylase] ligase